MADAIRILQPGAPAPERVAPDHGARFENDQRSVLAISQAKLKVGAVCDPMEQQADQVADRVMAILQRTRRDDQPEPEPQPEFEHEHEDEHERPAGDRASELIASLRRSPTRSRHQCGPGCVQRHAGHDHSEIGADGGELSDDLTSMLQRSSGGGAPIAEEVREPMEQAFGSNFADVRVHTESEVAPRIGASAFTIGRDIHFAPGQYRPGDTSGKWLLSHELTHVIQQGSAAPADDVGVSRSAGGCIRRHASKEHYMLGTMTPAQIKSIADAKKNVEDTGKPESFLARFKATKRPPAAELQEAVDAVAEQLVGLANWQKLGAVDFPDPVTIDKGSTAFSHTWGGQLVTVPCRDGELVCTVGELNALPDFFGSYDDLGKVDRSIAFKTFQVIRRESYIYLRQLEAQLTGVKYSYDKKNEAFTGIEDNTISVSMGVKLVDDVSDLMDTTDMLSGKTGTGPMKKATGEVGLDESITADATLGRNACHFPPESWLRWREHHEGARTLIASVTTLDELGARANEAIGRNAFGEHYLQDSFAGGHLINKGFVMAVAMEHATLATKKWRGMDKAFIDEMQTATAHRDAYQLPQAAQDRIDASAQGLPAVADVLSDPTMKARDPQSALEKARSSPGSATTKKEVEMDASGIRPGSMTFEQYRKFLNDFWFQKITNTLHDKYCVQGLMVASPQNPNMFRIYGDGHMMESSNGAEYAAETSRMSRTAINRLVQNKRSLLTPVVPGDAPALPPRPVDSVESIIARFPNKVTDDDGTVMMLVDWATGASMRKKIASIVAVLSMEFNPVTRLVKWASIAKEVSPGLSAEHGPF